jgi:CBS domain-containing protein
VIGPLSIRDIIHAARLSPPLDPGDSLAKAARLLRVHGLPVLPVAQGTQLIGLVHESDLLARIAEAPDTVAAMRSATVAEVVRPAGLVLEADVSVAEAARLMLDAGVSAAPVVDHGGRYLGVLPAREVAAAASGEPITASIAGLATPFGVHLTTGTVRAGASDLALASTGVALMLINLISINGTDWLRAQAHRLWPLLDSLTRRGSNGEAVEVIAVGIASLALFLLLLRLSPITGTHAAEHMVVHAIEEGEELTLEKVRPMPRVHPRCGTNLVALLVMIGIGQTLFSAISQANQDAGQLVLFGLVVVVMITWRRLGSGLQRLITTKPPSDRQLQRAIGVGEELLRRMVTPPARPRRGFDRLWNSGFLQVLAGFLVVFEAAHLLGL